MRTTCGALANLSLFIENMATRDRSGAHGADRLTQVMKVIVRLDHSITTLIERSRKAVDPSSADP